MRYGFLLCLCLAVSQACGQATQPLTQENAFNLNEQRKAWQHLVDKAKNGPVQWEKWCAYQLENGTITAVVTKPANNQKLLVSERFLELHSQQRAQLVLFLCEEAFKTELKKPLPVAIYLAKPDGKPGKKIGSLNVDSMDLQLTAKVKPDVNGDLQTLNDRLFALPPAK